MDKRWNKTLRRVLAFFLKPYVIVALFVLTFFALTIPVGRYYLLVRTEGLTSTITASTEALSFSLQEDRQSAWNLPAGIFLVTTDPSKNGDCEAKTEFVGGIDLLIGYQCTSGSNTRLEINGAAEVSVVITPAGKLRLTVKPHGKKPLDLRVVDAGDNTLFPPQQELGYETTLPAKIPNSDDVYQVRVPLIATSAQVGSHLHYVSTIDTSPDDFWQPTLLSGNVSIIAQNHPDTEKFDVHSEALDTGDVLGIGRDPNQADLGDEYDPEDEKTDLVWGMATIGQQVTTMSGTTELDQFMIHAVLHTTHRQLSVRRFGTAKGHTIEASQWSILSKWPNGQKAWFILVTAAFLLTTALTTTLTTFLTVSDFFRGKPLRKKKKKKKKKKKGGKNEY